MARRVAVVGGGPAGFYAAHYLLKRCQSVLVDVFEALPAPYGLVRYGVAPDHPEVKNCISQFEALGQDRRFRLFGNVRVGDGYLPLGTLEERYHAVLLCYGSESSRKLGIPGEDSSNVVDARTLVHWYNGHPAGRFDVDLSQIRSVVVLGHGNVGLDVSRMFLSTPDRLASTDVAERFLAQLRQSQIQSVHAIGRRGPLQASFTIKELREMTRLDDVAAFSHHDPIEESVLNSLSRPRRRLAALLEDMRKGVGDAGGKRAFHLRYNMQPVEICHDHSKRVTSIRMELTELETTAEGTMRAVGTGKHRDIPCDLVVKSIGYKGRSISHDLPFDHAAGVIRHQQGRVEGRPQLYCSGWIANGPVGTIATTMSNASHIAETILNDLNTEIIDGTEATRGGLSETDLKAYPFQGQAVTFDSWKQIERYEQTLGSQHGKPSEKLCSVEELLSVLTQPA